MKGQEKQDSNTTTVCILERAILLNNKKPCLCLFYLKFQFETQHKKQLVAALSLFDNLYVHSLVVSVWGDFNTLIVYILLFRHKHAAYHDKPLILYQHCTYLAHTMHHQHAQRQ